MDKSSFQCNPLGFGHNRQGWGPCRFDCTVLEKIQVFGKAQELAVDSVKIPKGQIMFERKGKPQKGVPWDVYAFLVCGHEPPFLPNQVRGKPAFSSPPLEEGALKMKVCRRPPPPK